jgi:H+/gluconate symporter-like permease
LGWVGVAVKNMKLNILDLRTAGPITRTPCALTIATLYTAKSKTKKKKKKKKKRKEKKKKKRKLSNTGEREEESETRIACK